jgi:hypothetical protein
MCGIPPVFEVVRVQGSERKKRRQATPHLFY